MPRAPGVGVLDSVWFVAGKLLGLAWLPPVNLPLLAMAGLALWPRWPGWGRTLLAGSLTGLILLGIPAIARVLLAPWQADACRPVTAPADAIVILGGGLREVAPEYGGAPAVKPLALERLRHGARLHRDTGLPILVTGGAAEGRPAEAAAMRETLVRDFGVPVRWVEDRARTTRENARNAARLLEPAGVKRIYLVSQGWHLPRAAPEFERLGLEVIPAGTGCEGAVESDWLDFLPDAQAWVDSYHAIHEGLGMVWYRLLRRLS